MMVSMNKFFVAVGFVAQLWLFEQTPAQANDTMTREEIAVSVSVPGENPPVLVAVLQVVAEGTIVGAVAIYDDAGTERAGDYLELYNTRGDLLAVGWIDRFGIERGAVDRGLLRGSQTLEGTFIVFVDGELI